MRRLLACAVVVLAAGVVVSLAAGSGSASGRWVVRDLGTLGGPQSEAVAVNERGQVIGGADIRLRISERVWVSRAFLWENGRMRDLGTLGGRWSSAADVNDQGQVVGSANTIAKDHDGYPISHAFVWRNGRVRDLGAPGGKGSRALAVNERGQILVTGKTTSVKADDGDLATRVFIWEGGRTRDLGTLGGAESWVELGHRASLNDRGQVVGFSDTADDSMPVFLWENGRMTDLGEPPQNVYSATINERGEILATSDPEIYASYVRRGGRWLRLPGLPGTWRALAKAINDRGLIVGACRGRGGKPWLPCRWRDRKAEALAVPFGDRGMALAVNNHGTIVGTTSWHPQREHEKGQRVVVWENNRATVLDTLGGNYSTVTDINDRDQIVGFSETQSGHAHAVLWTKTAR